MPGYQLVAVDPEGNQHATYAESDVDWRALERCYLEFMDEGWTGHYAKNLDTGVITTDVKDIVPEDVLPLNDDDVLPFPL